MEDTLEDYAPLGLENGEIEDERIIASSCSPGTTPNMARLNSGDSWCAGDVNNCFLQVDLGKRHKICAVATQGNRAPTSKRDYVSKYQVQFSDDSVEWTTYEEWVDFELMENGELDEVNTTLIESGAADDAMRLHDAMAGWGTDENTLIDILCTRNNAELAVIQTVYKEKYNKSLDEDLKGDLSGDLRTLLLELSKGERNQSSEVDIDLAKEDAKDLLAAGVDKWGTDEAAFIRVFTQRDLKQLAATFSEYEKLGKGDMASTINSEMSGDLRKSFLLLDATRHYGSGPAQIQANGNTSQIIFWCKRHSGGACGKLNVATDPATFFADCLQVALQEGDWKEVCRIVFSRNRVALEELSTAFKVAYGSELIVDIEDKYDGDKKASLLRKLRGKKTVKRFEAKVFEGNTDHLNVKTNYLKHPVIARFVRFYPLEWFVWPCLSVELYGAPADEEVPQPLPTVKNSGDDIVVEVLGTCEMLPVPTPDANNDRPASDDEKEQWERDRKVWEEEKKRMEEEIRRYEEEREKQRENKDWETEWKITEGKRITCELNRKELIDEKSKWEKEKIKMEQDWKKREDELKQNIEEEKKKRVQAEEKLKVILSREMIVQSRNRKPSSEDEKEGTKKRERRPSAVDKMIERDQKIREEEWKKFDEEKRSWEEQRIKFQQERKKWDVKRIEWEEQNRKKEEERRQKLENERKAREETVGRKLSEEEKRKWMIESQIAMNGKKTTTYTTTRNEPTSRHKTTIEVEVQKPKPIVKEFKPEIHFIPIEVPKEVVVDDLKSAPLAINDEVGELDENGAEEDGPAHVHNHDHDHDHEIDKEGHFDQFKRFMRSCDHLMPPTDYAATNAAETSFFSKYDEAESNLRPFPSWFGGLDMGSASRLYQPCNNPFSDLDIERLLHIDNEGIDGWRRLKRSRELEIWRKEGKGPVTIKATMILNKIPFKDAVDFVSDWSIRGQWDPTFDSVEVVDEAEDFRVLKCIMKKKRRCLALATMNVENLDEPYNMVMWKNTNHPYVPEDSETTLLTLDTLVCGIIIRPYHDGTKFCKITIITQLQSSAPGCLRNTYLTGNPSKWLWHLKKFHSLCMKQEKTQKAVGSDGVSISSSCSSKKSE